MTKTTKRQMEANDNMVAMIQKKAKMADIIAEYITGYKGYTATKIAKLAKPEYDALVSEAQKYIEEHIRSMAEAKDEPKQEKKASNTTKKAAPKAKQEKKDEPKPKKEKKEKPAKPIEPVKGESIGQELTDCLDIFQRLMDAGMKVNRCGDYCSARHIIQVHNGKKYVNAFLFHVGKKAPRIQIKGNFLPDTLNGFEYHTIGGYALDHVIDGLTYDNVFDFLEQCFPELKQEVTKDEK